MIEYPLPTSEALLRELDALAYIATLPAVGDWDESSPDGRVPVCVTDNAARLLRWAQRTPEI